jgi:predicted nucleic acid-binding protein
VTVVDTSAVVDLLLGAEAAEDVASLLARDTTSAAPDVLVFEVLAVLRRAVLRGALTRERAQAAVEDLGDVRVDLFPSLPLRHRAWELRDNLTAADGLFVALTEHLNEPLATKDAALARSATRLGLEVVELTPS